MTRAVGFETMLQVAGVLHWVVWVVWERKVSPAGSILVTHIRLESLSRPVHVLPVSQPALQMTTVRQWFSMSYSANVPWIMETGHIGLLKWIQSINALVSLLLTRHVMEAKTHSTYHQWCFKSCDPSIFMDDILLKQTLCVRHLMKVLLSGTYIFETRTWYITSCKYNYKIFIRTL